LTVQAENRVQTIVFAGMSAHTSAYFQLQLAKSRYTQRQGRARKSVPEIDVKVSADMSNVTDQGLEHGVRLSTAAAEKVRNLLAQEGREDLRLRVAVQPGGCSGLIYQLFFDERYLENDAVMDFDGVEVIVDQMSIPYLNGATIDFEDTIEKQGFTIDNPNAQGSCACGDSFS